VVSVALFVQGLALAGIVASSGSLPDRLGRVLALVVLTAAVLAAIDSPFRWTVGVGALVGGLVGTVVGLGIGVMHSVVARVDAVAAMALVALATGLLLLVVALSELVRGLPGWWRLLSVPVALTVVILVLFPVTQSVYATNVPRGTDSAATPADRGLAYEQVMVATRDGASLAAWYLPGSNHAAVVVLHGSGSSKESVLDQGAVLARHGYGVLLLDARGHGGSSGYAMDFGWFGEADVSGAVDYLIRRADVDPTRIGVLGESMGGEEAIGALGADLRLRVVVAEGATNRIAEDRGWLPNGLNGQVQRVIDRVTYTVAGWLTSAPEPAPLRDSIAKAAPRPVLLVAAGNVPDEQAAADLMRTAAPTSVTVWVAPNANHTGALRAQPAKWTQRVTRFLDAAMLPAPG
jgi:alpha-beta hydrolase superfamily lysophospholipase